MIQNLDNLISDFIKVAELSGFSIVRKDILHERQTAPHKPNSLPGNYFAVYVFSLPEFENQVLKVGKVGPKSNARYLSQHYNPNSSMSNLAKSLLSSNFFRENKIEKPTEGNVGDWIKENTDRENFLFLDKPNTQALVNLFEIFLQSRLKPRFEG